MRLPDRLAVPLVAVVLGAGLSGCGSGDEDRGAPPPATTTTAAADQRAVGLGFEVQVPPRWTDVSLQLNNGLVRYDVAAADTTAKGFKSNVTIKHDGGTRLEGRSLEELDASARRIAARDPKVTVRTEAPLTLDGESALASVSFRTQQGMRLAGRQVIALHAGELYSILLTSTAGDARADRTLRTMLATWRWTR